MSTPINEVNIPNVVIPKFQTNEVWLNGIPFIPHNHAPVSLQIGFPIVDTVSYTHLTLPTMAEV